MEQTETTKAMTIEDITNQEGPIEIAPDADEEGNDLRSAISKEALDGLIDAYHGDWPKIKKVLDAIPTGGLPQNEEELVKLVNALDLDWAKIADVLSKISPENIKASKNSEIGKVVLGRDDDNVIVSNIVGKKALRRVQLRTIKDLANKVMATYGPMESNTAIITGSSKETMVTKYSKDGHTVLKKNTYVDPIEMSIQAEAENITGRVEREVGDGTSSAIEMAALIFEQLCNIEESTSYRPYALMRSFQRVVDMIKKEIKSAGREITLDDIYDIAMISTNGNEDIAGKMKKIYKEYGNDVYIDVRPNTIPEDQVKVYDGMTIDVGYSDVAYVNSNDGTCDIRDARVYYFIDPIDTKEMVSLFEKIVIENIMTPLQEQGEPIPTVIVSPIMSRDMSSLMEQVVSMLYKYNEAGMISQKPPLLVITKLGVYEEYFNDISRLCGCKPIAKYNDPEIQKKDIEKGIAPTLDNVTEFYGKCEEVEAGVAKTKFIGPDLIYKKDEEGNIVTDEKGDPEHSETYSIVLSSLEGELVNAQNNKSDANTIGNLKRRINSLKANMIDFLVGGMSISDRDAKRDLVEDCVLSCRSASRNGVGFAANFEGYMASMLVWKRLHNMEDTEDKRQNAENRCDELMALIISTAYKTLQEKLYFTYEADPDIVAQIINDNVKYGNPLNLATGLHDGKVVTSIDTDCVILDSIAKIITLMFTANQAYLPSPVGNKYLNEK